MAKTAFRVLQGQVVHNLGIVKNITWYCCKYVTAATRQHLKMLTGKVWWSQKLKLTVRKNCVSTLHSRLRNKMKNLPETRKDTKHLDELLEKALQTQTRLLVNQLLYDILLYDIQVFYAFVGNSPKYCLKVLWPTGCTGWWCIVG